MPLRELIAVDPERSTRRSDSAVGLYLDYSKNGSGPFSNWQATAAPPAHDSSTTALIQRYRQLREERL